MRQFELALRRLRQLSSRNEGVPDELDLDETVEETASNAGRLSLVWRKSRKNAVKVLLLMDVGGSMHPYIRLCSQLFSAVNRSTHFKDLRTYYFHNCVYDWLYTSTRMTSLGGASPPGACSRSSPATTSSIIVGDAAMAPSELMARDGIIWWGFGNDEPGIEWLRRLRRHFDHSVWLNTIPETDWDRAYGSVHHPQGARGLPHVRAHGGRPAGGRQEADGGALDQVAPPDVAIVGGAPCRCRLALGDHLLFRRRPRRRRRRQRCRSRGAVAHAQAAQDRLAGAGIDQQSGEQRRRSACRRRPRRPGELLRAGGSPARSPPGARRRCGPGPCERRLRGASTRRSRVRPS